MIITLTQRFYVKTNTMSLLILISLSLPSSSMGTAHNKVARSKNIGQRHSHGLELSHCIILH